MKMQPLRWSEVYRTVQKSNTINLHTAKLGYDISRFNVFYYPFKSDLLGTKLVFKQQDSQMLGLKLNK